MPSSPRTSLALRLSTAVLGLAVAAAAPRDVSAQRVLTIIARDTMLELPSSLPAGITTVRLVLQAKTRRELVVHRVPAGTEPAVLARGAVGRPAKWFEQWSFGGPAVPRDSAPDASVTMDLRPGRYLVVAYAVDSAGRPRGDRVLWQPVVAIAASVLIPGRFPVPDATVKVRDSRIEVTGKMRPGQRTIQVENAGGRPHEIVVGRLKPGKTVDDVRRWNRERNDPPPFVYVGGITPMSTGMTAQVRLVFQSGEHVILCPMRATGEKSADHQRGVIGTFRIG